MSQRPTVVFLHGMARTWRSMAGIRRHVAAAGYRTWARTYPSRRMPIDALARTVAQQIRQDVDGPVIAVTHSMGGILVRHMAELLAWDGVVMLAPPNSGSAVARRLHTSGLFKWFYGPAGLELGSADMWPAPPRPFGVIAGTAGATWANPSSLAVSMLNVFDKNVAHDGTVAVDETRHPEMACFATVGASHTWIMNHARTRQLVLHFLNHRGFPA